MKNTCKFCGYPTNVDPADQEAPADYCSCPNHLIIDENPITEEEINEWEAEDEAAFQRDRDIVISLMFEPAAGKSFGAQKILYKDSLRQYMKNCVFFALEMDGKDIDPEAFFFVDMMENDWTETPSRGRVLCTWAHGMTPRAIMEEAEKHYIAQGIIWVETAEREGFNREDFVEMRERFTGLEQPQVPWLL